MLEKEYPEAAVERAMKVQEVIMRAMAKRITWWEAAEILGIHVNNAAFPDGSQHWTRFHFGVMSP